MKYTIIFAVLLVIMQGCTVLVIDLGRTAPQVTVTPVGDPTATPETLPLPTSTPEPTADRALRQYYNPGPKVLNLRAGPGTDFTDKGDVEVGQRVGLLFEPGDSTWYVVCLYLHDGSCSDSYWIAGWLIKEIDD